MIGDGENPIIREEMVKARVSTWPAGHLTPTVGGFPKEPKGVT